MNDKVNFGSQVNPNTPIKESTYISPAKTILGREEEKAERFPKSSNAISESLRIIIVCPRTVMELIGPDKWKDY